MREDRVDERGAVAEKSPRKAGKSGATKVKHAGRKRERDVGQLQPLPLSSRPLRHFAVHTRELL